MSEATELKLKRRLLKTQTTTFKKFCDQLDENALNDNILLQLETRLQQFLPTLDLFLEIQVKIDSIQGNVNENEDDPEIEAFQNRYFDIVTKAKCIIAEYRKVQPKSPTSSCNSMCNPNETPVSNVLLPTINLPKFNGAFDQWEEFYDSFNAMIHTNNALSDVHKFYYLKSSLTSKAAETLQNVSADNYGIAWELLRERFQDKKLLINSYLKTLFDIPHVKRGSHSSLRLLFDTMTKSVRSLRNIGQPVNQWDMILIYIIVSKFDDLTRTDWESFKIDGELPTLANLNEFLKTKCKILETIHLNKLDTNSGTHNKKRESFCNTQVESHSPTCGFCDQSHLTYQCEKFTKLSVDDRINEAKRRRLCLNCLRKGHTVRECRRSTCNKCFRKHHTVLHLDTRNLVRRDKEEGADTKTYEDRTSNTVNEITQSDDSISRNPTVVAHSGILHSQVLLSTAYVTITDHYGKFHECRALLDSGAQSNFITERMCNQLNLKRSNINVSVKGISHASFNIHLSVQIQVNALSGGYEQTITCLVLKKITEPLPAVSFDKNILKVPSNIRLADPSFNKSRDIDLLIGSCIFYDLLSVGQISLGKGLPILQKSKLGWILAGPLTYGEKSQSIQTYVETEMTNLENQIQKFWLLEEYTSPLNLASQEQKQCKEYFVRTTIRDPSGRFVVRLPFKQNLSQLGDSKTIALKRFHNLEKRFRQNPKLKSDYIQFLEEYKNLQQMSLVNLDDNECTPQYFLPHHAVIKESHLTTKVRVVFDGSAKTNTGLSVNDVMMEAPILQSDLFALLLRFRKYAFVLNADITKMYRQILVHKEDRRFQRIFFRKNESEPLACYELNTVTYGTAAAPFLAIRCLHQLAVERKISDPKISNIIKNDFYVDDLLTGSDSLEELWNYYNSITRILNSAGFELRKWTSNEKRVLDLIRNDSRAETRVIHL